MDTTVKTCDLCEQEIKVGRRKHPTLSYPLTKEMVERLVQGKAVSVGFMGGLPETIHVDICQGCADGLMPMVRDAVEKLVLKIVAHVEERRTASQEA